MVALLALSACVQVEQSPTAPLQEPSNISLNSQVKANDILNLTSQNMRLLQETNNPFRESLFDVQEMNGKKNLKGSTHYVHHALLTTTFYPKSLYGNNFKHFTPYCPIFFDSHQNQALKNYFNKLNQTHPISEADLAHYFSLFAYSSCALINYNYQTKQKQKSEIDNLVLADKFAITLFLKEHNEKWVNIIIHQNDMLHEQHIVSSSELEAFTQKMKTYQLKQTKNKNIYQWWLATLEVDKLK